MRGGFPAPAEAFGVQALYGAMRRALRGHRRSPEAAAFALEAGPRLCALSRALLARRWRPSETRTFLIRRPKPRRVTAFAFADRVVHHALVGAIEPALDVSMDPGCYACRRGKGLHRAVAHAQELLAEHAFVLCLDVRQYFERLPDAVVQDCLRAQEVPEPYVALCMQILAGARSEADAARGMAIGALTSQLFGNLCLGPVDRRLRAMGDLEHVRYMDDILIGGPDKRRLWEAKRHVSEVLARLGLALRADATRLGPSTEGALFLGFQVFAGGPRLTSAERTRLGRRIRGTLKAARAGRVAPARADGAVAARLIHASFGDAVSIRRALARTLFEW